jgi:hypothetical protein
VAAFVTVTLALGTAAPVGSVTVPFSVAPATSDWAKAAVAEISSIKTSNMLIFIRMSVPELDSVFVTN